MIFDRHVNLKYKYGNRHFWRRGYIVINKIQIENYVNMVEVRISIVIIMPFKNNELSKYEFESPKK